MKFWVSEIAVERLVRIEVAALAERAERARRFCEGLSD